MAQKLVFSINRELFRFLILDKRVFYTDRKWSAWIQCLPAPENFLMKIKLSRNKIPSTLGNMFTLNDEERKEYESAKDEEALAEIVIRDARLKGATLIANAKEDNKNLEDIKFIN